MEFLAPIAIFISYLMAKENLRFWPIIASFGIGGFFSLFIDYGFYALLPGLLIYALHVGILYVWPEKELPRFPLLSFVKETLEPFSLQTHRTMPLSQYCLVGTVILVTLSLILGWDIVGTIISCFILYAVLHHHFGFIEAWIYWALSWLALSAYLFSAGLFVTAFILIGCAGMNYIGWSSWKPKLTYYQS